MTTRLKLMQSVVDVWDMFPRCLVCGQHIASPLYAEKAISRPNRVIHRLGCPPEPVCTNRVPKRRHTKREGQ